MLSKDEIFKLMKEKGVKASFINDLISGYRGKITDWKNNKTTLNENEISIITDFLLSREKKEISPSQTSDKDIKFALFGGEEGITDEMFEKVKQFAKFVKEQELGNDNK